MVIFFFPCDILQKVNKDLVTKHPELKEWATAMYIITNSFAESNIECAKLPFSDQRFVFFSINRIVFDLNNFTIFH